MGKVSGSVQDTHNRGATGKPQVDQAKQIGQPIYYVGGCGQNDP